MSATEALARIGSADLGEEAHDFRMQIRRWFADNVPPRLPELAQWNLPNNRFDRRAQALAGPQYREWERRLLAA